jgi:hypothetical protein
MLRVFDFLCPNDHLSESFVNSITREINCPVCGQTALKQISTPRVSLEGTTGAFPGAAMQWERKRAEKLKSEQKASGLY